MVDGDDNVAFRSRKGEEVERGWYDKGIEVYVEGGDDRRQGAFNTDLSSSLRS